MPMPASVDSWHSCAATGGGDLSNDGKGTDDKAVYIETAEPCSGASIPTAEYRSVLA